MTQDPNALIPAEFPAVGGRTEESIVAFLLGAGASVEAAVPDTANLICEFRTTDGDQKVGEFLDRLESWAQSQDRILDIELVLETLQRLATWQEDPLSGFATTPITVDGIDPRELLRKLRNFIKAKVLVDPSRIDYLKPLRGFVDVYRPLHVYSVNYDTAIEVFCAEHKLKYRDGFDEAWNPEVLDEPNLDVRLFKLHGSVTWYRSNRGRFLKIPILLQEDQVELVTRERAEALMLYPAQKFEYVEPLFELLLQAKRRLVECQILIAVGYSFRDEHIRRLLWDIARERPDKFRVVLVSPQAGDIYRKRLLFYEDNRTYSSLAGRVICLPFLFGKFFPALQADFLRTMMVFTAEFDDVSAQERRGYPANWESTVVHAAQCGDYENVRTILEKPTVITKLDYIYRLRVTVLSLFQAVINGDESAGKHFWDLFRDAWRTTINDFVVVAVPAQSKLDVTVRRNNWQRHPGDLVREIAELRGELERRIRWMRGDAESTVCGLSSVVRVLKDLHSAMRIWLGATDITFDAYESARRSNMSSELTKLFKTLRTTKGEVVVKERARDLQQEMINTEHAVVSETFEKIQFVFSN